MWNARQLSAFTVNPIVMKAIRPSTAYVIQGIRRLNLIVPEDPSLTTSYRLVAYSNNLLGQVGSPPSSSSSPLNITNRWTGCAFQVVVLPAWTANSFGEHRRPVNLVVDA